MLIKTFNPNYDIIYKDSSIKTTRYALQFLLSVNESIDKISGSKVRRESAIGDIEKCKDAISDFDHLLRCFENQGVKENDSF